MSGQDYISDAEPNKACFEDVSIGDKFSDAEINNVEGIDLQGDNAFAENVERVYPNSVIYMEADPIDRAEREIERALCERSWDDSREAMTYGLHRPIKVGEEVHSIREACNLFSVDVDVYLNVRKKEVAEIIRKTRPTVLHFSGHGVESKELLVCKAGSYGKVTEYLSVVDFVSSVKESYAPDLILFAACNSAQYAEELVKNGCAKVAIGARGSVTEECVQDFVCAFYRTFFRRNEKGVDFPTRVTHAFDQVVGRSSFEIFPHDCGETRNKGSVRRIPVLEYASDFLSARKTKVGVRSMTNRTDVANCLAGYEKAASSWLDQEMSD